MSKDKTPLLPDLRFPEFQKQPLHTVKLRDVTSESKTRNGEKSPKLNVMGVSKFDGIVPMEERLIASDASRYKLVRKHWFAYNPMRLNIGSIARWNGDQDVLVSPDYIVFKCDQDGEVFGLSPDFFDQFRQSDVWAAFVNEAGDGGVRVRIYYDNIGEIRFGLPSLPEQQKIAECLSSLDELTKIEVERLEALRTQKKGLMQNLFPRAGETTPEMRFPEFESSEQWEEAELGPLTNKVGSGTTPKGGSQVYKKKGRPFVRSQNVGWGNLLLDDIAFIDEQTHQTFSSTELVLDDVLLNISGASIGRCAIVEEKIVGGNVNQHVCIIRTQQQQLSPVFLNQYIISPLGQKQIDNFQAGGNRQGLNFSQIRSFQIPLPSLPEQQRVADCLSSLDDLITAQRDKVEALKLHKKGLMQGLFPQMGDRS